MLNSKPDAERVRARKHSLDAEQLLCTKALNSTSYDSMTDKEWVALCEDVAGQARKEKRKP